MTSPSSLPKCYKPWLRSKRQMGEICSPPLQTGWCNCSSMTGFQGQCQHWKAYNSHKDSEGLLRRQQPENQSCESPVKQSKPLAVPAVNSYCHCQPDPEAEQQNTKVHKFIFRIQLLFSDTAAQNTLGIEERQARASVLPNKGLHSTATEMGSWRPD